MLGKVVASKLKFDISKFIFNQLILFQFLVVVRGTHIGRGRVQPTQDKKIVK